MILFCGRANFDSSFFAMRDQSRDQARDQSHKVSEWHRRIGVARGKHGRTGGEFPYGFSAYPHQCSRADNDARDPAATQQTAGDHGKQSGGDTG